MTINVINKKKSKEMGKSVMTFFCIALLLFQIISCSDDSEEQPSFPTEEEVSGHWQLHEVFAGDAQVPFSDYIDRIQNEFFRFDDDNGVHHVAEYEIFAQGSNNTWSLSKDTLTIGGLGVFRVEAASPDQLELVPVNLFGLRLIYKSIAEEEFPEIVFDATIDGQTVNTSNAVVDEYDTHYTLYGDGVSFWMAVNLPGTVRTGDTFDLSSEEPGVGVLVIRNDHEYGYRKSGLITVVKKTDRYINITLDVVVADADDNQVAITDGVIGSLTFAR